MRRGLYIIPYLLLLFCGVCDAQYSYVLTSIAGTGSAAFLGDGLPATNAQINNPKAITLDGAGNVYFADYSNQRIRKIDASGIITSIAGTGTAGYTGDGSPATAANINYPWGIATDSTGNVYFSTGTAVREINISGIISTVAGTGTAGYSGDGGAATLATLNGAAGIAIDGYGNIYIADGNNNCVRMVATTGVISTIAGNGTAANAGDGGPATAAELNNPKAIALDVGGNIYVSVSGARVRKISPAGIISTFAGTGTTGFSGDGSAATAAKIANTVSSICTDNGGNVYINDSARIRKINTTGNITTVAGNGFRGGFGLQCSATTDSLYSDNFITMDGAGALYISTDGEQRILKGLANAAPHFLGGHLQSFGVCIGSGANPITTLLAISDLDAGQLETWSVILSPTHGTLVGTYYTNSNGGEVVPIGLYYSPSGSSIATDVIKMRITDCQGNSDTTTINIAITASPFVPVAMPGPTNICLGTSAFLYDTLGGGTWTSSDPTTASIGSVYGNITGVALGSTTISYSRYMSCGTASTTTTVNVVSVPSDISGTPLACAGGGTATLSDATTGGIWSSGNTAIATIGSTGIMTGVTAGTVFITYTLPSGCFITAHTTINPLPSIPKSSSSDTLSVCAGSTLLMLDSLSGGTWHSSNSNASIGITTGIVYGASVGTSVINYTLRTGCAKSATLTINAVPSAISGPANVCAGSSITLTNSTTGGTWSSTNTSIATAGTGGIVTGINGGVVDISYTNASGCAAVQTVTVNNLHPITGSPILCGSPITLSDSATGGVWSESGPAVSIGSSTGIVTPVSLGTATISYSLPTGCVATKTVTVNTPPSAIAGLAALCAGATLSFSDTLSGGTWSSNITAVGTIGALTGILTGISGGADTVKYTMTSGCFVTKPVTVNTSPTAITGPSTICSGDVASESETVPGGYWSATGTSITVGSTSGAITGVGGGVTTIVYAMPTGCAVTKNVTANPLPSVIAGTAPICLGASLTLSDTLTGGAWSSVGGGITTSSATGLVTGIGIGTSVITYTLPSGCMRTAAITVNPLPGAITGILSTGICPGQTESLTESGGGIWSAGGTAASIGSTGIVTGIAAGPATITYTLPTGCKATAALSVNPMPRPITGTTSLCLSSTTTLADTTTGGAWFSSDYSTAYISSGGDVTGYATGTATISYIAADGCMATTTFTVNPAPGVITGIFSLCVGGTTTLSNSATGGTWSSSDTTKARVTSSGAVTGISTGSVTIIYSTGTGCTVSQAITVLPPPTSITGSLSVCRGSTTVLSDGTAGGVWSSTGSAVAIGSTGIVTGTGTGIASIYYTTGPGCVATAVVTVNTMPAAITGAGSLCAGSTTTLTDAGGTWSCIPVTTGTISTAGILAGISTGTLTVSYTTPAGCAVSKIVTVNALPPAISGPSVVCIGQTIAETDSATGIWSRSNTNINIGSSSGVVTGMVAGTSIITYTLSGTGCAATKTVTVNSGAGLISGPTQVCIGSSIILAAGGTGTWSATPGTGSVIMGTTGLVTGSTAGTATVTFSTGTGCTTSITITVNPLPGTIGGTGSICQGSSLTLTETGSGAWSTASSAVSVGSTTGLVTGITAGTPTITFTLTTTGCYRTATVTVNPNPAVIGGPSAVCIGAHISLTESGAGAWISGSTGVLTIGSGTGMVTGITTGTSAITFTAPTGCSATTTVTVSNSPTVVTGTGLICTGTTDTLTDTASGGIWSSASATISIGSLSGIVTGVSAGTAIITYSLGTGCTVTTTETVTAAPAAIRGIANLCVGATTALTDGTTGGTWSITPSATGTISTAGIVTGRSPGTAYVTYSTGTCAVNDTITVNTTPLPITIGSGPATVCQGSTITAADAVSGGIWSSTSSTITMGSTGIITGVNAGAAVITYSIGSCTVMATLTVNPEAPLTGAAGMCTGTTTTLSDAVAGGRWTATGATSVGSTGIITGVSAGTGHITYTLPTGCTATYTVTVNSSPALITGVLHVCIGSTTNLSNSAGGGTWSISGSAASIGSISGIVTGLSAGTAPVVYSLGTGCTAGTTVTVNLPPPAITGTMNVCPGGSLSLTESGSGTWSVGAGGAAIVGSATGIVTGVSAGTSTISFTSSYGCMVTAIVTVNPLPDLISGPHNVCAGATITLSDASAGGSWTGSGPLTIGSTGAATGISAGTGVVTYTLPTGCATTMSVFVNALPAAISGTTAMCLHSGVTLSDSSPGGFWSSPDGTGIITLGSTTGAITGIALGTATISYTLDGCSISTTVNVTSLPDNIAGNTHLCVGITDTLTDRGGGMWSSSNPAVATIGSSTGAVTGIIPGAVSITYSLGVGCTVSKPVTVNVTPASITGPSIVCSGNTITLHDITAGGAWSSGNTTLATAGTGGIITGIGGGTVNISYTSITTNCASVYPIAVIQVPAITGGDHICAWGSTMMVYDSLPGGSFTSTLVTISDSGAVLSYAPGTASITYTESHGCYVITHITVNPLPGDITGIRNLCIGATTTLYDTSTGGVWSLAGGAAVTVGSSSGLVTAIAAGAATISYTTSRYGCSQNITITVQATPSTAGTITGSNNICSGSSTTFTDTTAGGVWSGGGVIATAGSSTGIVSGIRAGTATITYTVTNHCGTIATSKTVTVNPDVTPAISISTANDTLCAGIAASYISAIVNGGTGPAYQWMVNGVAVTGGTGSTYSYIPANGDAIVARLTSNATCVSPASVLSDTITMTVDPQVIPSVTIIASPGSTILTGATIIFTAAVTNGGTAPAYQWMLDGVAIPGATDATYTASNYNDGDTVSFVVMNSGICGGNTGHSNAVGITVINNEGIQPLAHKGEPAIWPNPCYDRVTITGAIGHELIIYDMMGVEVYRTHVILDREQINIATLANGIYMVKVTDASGATVTHKLVKSL